MVKINWTRFALQDLNEIAEFISKDSVRYAQLTVKYLFESPSLLKIHPKAGRIVPEFNEPNLRELIRGSYRIVYRIVTKDRVDILTVHHSSRLFKNFPPLKK
jgi:addiction module RelE/StbE family toxin